MINDYVLKRGRIIDPASGTDRVGDLSVREGRITAIAPKIELEKSAEVFDVEGCVVCPGLIDFHTHVYWGNEWGIDADSVGPATCVTTFVDQGTSGPGNFDGFYEHVIKPSRVRIYAFLHIAHNGLLGAVNKPDSLRFIGELEDIRLAMVGGTIETARRYPEIIRGVKVRASIESAGGHTLEAVRLARKAARVLGLPLVAHVGQPPATIEDILENLERGDILTHSFRGPLNSLLDRTDGILPQAVKARERGVLFDIGHGKGSFSFTSAEKLLAAGFAPDIISSDLHAFSIDGPAFDLPTTMSKFLALGADLQEIIRSVTSTPAAVLGKSDELGSLAVGAPADIAVFDLEEAGETKAAVTFEDVNGKTIHADRRIAPRMTFREGRLLWSAR